MILRINGNSYVAMCDWCEVWAAQEPVASREAAEMTATDAGWLAWYRNERRMHECPDCLRTPSLVECCACKPVLVEV